MSGEMLSNKRRKPIMIKQSSARISQPSLSAQLQEPTKNLKSLLEVKKHKMTYSNQLTTLNGDITVEKGNPE